jgi:hypothetical protein
MLIVHVIEISTGLTAIDKVSLFDSIAFWCGLSGFEEIDRHFQSQENASCEDVERALHSNRSVKA